MTYSNNSSNVSGAQYVDSGTTPGSGAQILRDGSTFYDTASSRVQQGQRIDITDQIRLYHDLYGGSDNTQAGGLAASKSLNYAPAPTMQQAQPVKTTVYPFTFKLMGQVGLFGAENYYVRVDVDLLTPLNAEFEEDGWFPADIEYGSATVVNTYESEVITFGPDEVIESNNQQLNDNNRCKDYIVNPNDPVSDWITQQNCYIDAIITDPIPFFWDPYVSVRLKDIGTGNIYIDNWLEPMLYTRERKMWGYDKMYIRPKDFFYVGVHARNTRHLPYNIEVIVGEEYKQSSDLNEAELVADGGIVY